MTKDKLIDFLIKTEIPDDIDSEKEKQIVSEIFKYSWDITPKKLYRYRNCTDYSFDALENDKFLLTKPTLFNDPYDSLLYINRQKIIDEITKPSKGKEDIIHKLNTDLDFRKSQIELLGNEFVEKFSKVESFKNEIEKEVYKSLSNTIHSKFIDDLIDESIKSLKQSSLVGCLSERIDSVLMWSHYAENHTGFALNYDFNERYSMDTKITGLKATEFTDKKLFPVKYTNQRFNATYYVEFHFIDNYYRSIGLELKKPFFDKLFYYKILLFKSMDWEYEKEWRIIKQTNLNYDDNKSNIDFIENIKPKEIYLGANIEKSNKDRLIEISKSKNIPIHQMNLDLFSENYRLTIDKN
jgi:hypothetical protein